MTSEEFKVVCAHLSPLIKEARYRSAFKAEEHLALETRHESIFIGTRACGKTAITRVSPFGQDLAIQEAGGYLDQADQPLRDMARTITAMLKMRRMHRSILPKYNPKIFLRPETWRQLKGRFHWVELHQIAEVAFPKEMFWAALLEQGASPDALAWFGPAWLKKCEDATGRLLPGFAYDAMAATVARTDMTPNMAKWQGFATAAADLVKSFPDLCYWLPYCVPADKTVYARHATLTMPLDRIVTRLRRARLQDKVRLPRRMSPEQYVRYLEVAGVCHVNQMRYIVVSRPYAVGATYLKATLTADGLRRMLSE
jgi:hypothetical protein